MSTTQFIQANKTRIENIDGNLDEAAITIMGESGRLEFYYFENGVLVNAKAKNTNLVEWWSRGGTAVYIPYAYSIMYRVPRALGSIYAWRGDFRDLE